MPMILLCRRRRCWWWWWFNFPLVLGVRAAGRIEGPNAPLLRVVTLLVVCFTSLVLGGSTTAVLNACEVPTGCEEAEGEEGTLRNVCGGWVARCLLDESGQHERMTQQEVLTKWTWLWRGSPLHAAVRRRQLPMDMTMA